MSEHGKHAGGHGGHGHEEFDPEKHHFDYLNNTKRLEGLISAKRKHGRDAWYAAADKHLRVAGSDRYDLTKLKDSGVRESFVEHMLETYKTKMRDMGLKIPEDEVDFDVYLSSLFGLTRKGLKHAVDKHKENYDDSQHDSTTNVLIQRLATDLAPEFVTDDIEKDKGKNTAMVKHLLKLKGKDYLEDKVYNLREEAKELEQIYSGRDNQGRPIGTDLMEEHYTLLANKFEKKGNH